jgi:hypothetical protein
MVPMHSSITISRSNHISISISFSFFQSELALWLLAESPSDRPSAQAISTSRVFSELLNKLTPSQLTRTGETTHNP